MTIRDLTFLSLGIDFGVLWMTAVHFLPDLIADHRARRAARREGRP